MQTTLQVGERVVEIEYKLAPQMVVFSHGFGVRRDARGMFTDIAAGLPGGWGYVLFDYDSFDVTTNQQKVVGFSTRVQTLQAVIDWTRRQAGVEQVHAVGHSMGTLALADLAPASMGKIVLLAPPLSLGLRFAELYIKRPGAEHEGKTWSIPRSDGTTTLVDDDALAELVSIDAEGELAKLGVLQQYTIVIAGADEIIPDEDYTELIVMPNVTMIGVDRANHDFSGEARPKLVDSVVKLLTTDASKVAEED